MSAGAMSAATSSSGSSPAKSRGVTGVGASPCSCASARKHALNDLLQVGLALAQVVVLHLVETARASTSSWADSAPFGVVVTVNDPLAGFTSERLIVQEHQVHVEQCRKLVGRVVGQLVLQGLEFLHDGIPSTQQAGDLGLNLIGCHEIVGHVDTAGRHQHRAADGHAA